MLDANEKEIFQADIPYEVDFQGNIENEDGLKVSLNHIWVDFHVVYQEKRKKLCVDCGKEERNPGLDVCGPCYHKRIWGEHSEETSP